MLPDGSNLKIEATGEMAIRTDAYIKKYFTQ